MCPRDPRDVAASRLLATPPKVFHETRGSSDFIVLGVAVLTWTGSTLGCSATT